MSLFRRLLFQLARSRAAGLFIGWMFEHMSFAIPVHRLRETDTLLAFEHPKPGYPFHILIVPKKAVASMMQITSADAKFLADVFQTVQSLVAEYKLETNGYRLICNGGAHQDVPQLHFHLISERHA